MKKFVFLLATGLFFCIMVFISGCEKPIVEPLAPSVEVSVSPETVIPGGTSTVTWHSINAESVKINNEIQPTSGSLVIKNIQTEMTYTVIAQKGWIKSIPKIVKILIFKSPTLTVYAIPTTIVRGNSTLITWNSSDSTTSIDLPQVIGKEGSISISPVETTEYHFVSTKKGGTTSLSVIVTVTEPTPPTLTVYAIPTTIVRGNSTLITWNSSDSTTSIDLPQVIGKEGSISISPVETTEYHFVSTNKIGKTSLSLIVTVTDPLPPTDEELLCNYGPWKMIKLEFMNGPGLPWYEGSIWDCMQDNLYYFYLIPTKKVVSDGGEIPCSPGEARIHQGSWFLTGNMLNTGDPNHLKEIIVLNQDTLIWVYHGGQTSTRETFIHP